MNIFENIDYGVLTNTYIILKITDAFGQREAYWDTLLMNSGSPSTLNAAGSVAVRVYISKVLRNLGPIEVINELNRTLISEESTWESLGIISVDGALIGQELTSEVKNELLWMISQYSEYCLILISDSINIGSGYGYGYGYGQNNDYIQNIE